MHRIAALCLPQVVAFDLSVVAEAFSLAYRRGEPLYEFTACAETPGRIETTTGFGVDALAGLEAVHAADTVFVPGYRHLLDPLDPAVADALRAVHERGGRVASICTGAFALAHCGLLDGRRATTHWFAAGELARMFPAAEIDPGVLYCEDDRVLTSAGLSAGIDLCLHIIRSDHGESLGSAVARAMVASPHREGGQAQFIERPVPPSVGGLGDVRRWALENLSDRLDVTTLASRAAMSPRHFARRFAAETGSTPLQWVIAQRVREARRLLEETDLPIEDVAQRAGFGSAPSLRQHFGRAMGTSPAAYRRTFRVPV
jgi:transcriptional regulator GlxA family with amidase domain